MLLDESHFYHRYNMFWADWLGFLRRFESIGQASSFSIVVAMRLDHVEYLRETTKKQQNLEHISQWFYLLREGGL